MSKNVILATAALVGFLAIGTASAAYTDSVGAVVNPTGLVVADEKGKQYNIDSILDMNKVLVIHTTYHG